MKPKAAKEAKAAKNKRDAFALLVTIALAIEVQENKYK